MIDEYSLRNIVLVEQKNRIIECATRLLTFTYSHIASHEANYSIMISVQTFVDDSDDLWVKTKSWLDVVMSGDNYSKSLSLRKISDNIYNEIFKMFVNRDIHITVIRNDVESLTSEYKCYKPNALIKI